VEFIAPDTPKGADLRRVRRMDHSPLLANATRIRHSCPAYEPPATPNDAIVSRARADAFVASFDSRRA
jgi:hypothetical protein